MEGPGLNCAYCAIFDALDENIYPFEIPEGKHFISLNLAVEKCLCIDPPLSYCEKWATVIGKYCYGTPVFGRFPKPTFPGWGDPTVVTVIDPNP